jgi:MFS family permease
LLSSAIFGLLTFLLPANSFLEWGWRIPFAMSALIVVFGLWLRSGIAETPIFTALREHGKTAEAPFTELIRGHRRALLVAGAARIGPDVIYALLVVFSLSYLTQFMGLPRSLALAALLSGAAANMIVTPLFGRLADRFGTRAVYIAGIAASVPLALLFFPVVETGSAFAIVAIVSVGMVFHAAMYAAQGSFIVTQFEPRLRYAGSSTAYTFGSLAAGGAFAPLIMTSLIARTGSPFAISLYAVIALLVTGVAIIAGKGRR